ncbi:UNVERIFIED_CONTAM: formate dehydrogenase accessory protein FdhE [Methylobacteriaceae bacterium AG10]|nr:formate dehydrogenase accessory protein FdhE [Methylobacteriaceae bacterium AG10]
MARFFKRTPAPASAGEAVSEAPRPERRPREIQPDPDQIGISGSVPFVRLPDPARLFADRAKRFAALAPDHPLGAYLGFMARVARAQADVQATLDLRPALPSDLGLRLEHGMPALARNLVTEDPACLACIDGLIAAVDLGGAPAEAVVARDQLRAAGAEDRLDLATQIFEGAFPVERIAECVFVAAGLQVYLAACAAALDRKALKPVADGVCPACGGAPTASLIVGWTPADKARYLSCAQCGTLWNHVRIRCTACGSGEGISYYGLDEVSKDVQVETCTACHGYLKHLHQHRDPALDPVADDIASYGLDLKIAEEGFRKAGLNLLFVS